MIPDPDLQSDPETPAERPRWERIDGETDYAYAAFARYRDLGPVRSCRKAAAVFYHDSTDVELVTASQLKTTKKWSAANDWYARAHARDDYLDQVRLVTEEVEIRAMNARQATLGRNLQAVGGIVITGDGRDLKAAQLTPAQAIRAVEVGAKLERTARGEPDTITRTEEQVAEADARAEVLKRGAEILDDLQVIRDRRSAEA